MPWTRVVPPMTNILRKGIEPARNRRCGDDAVVGRTRRTSGSLLLCERGFAHDCLQALEGRQVLCRTTRHEARPVAVSSERDRQGPEKQPGEPVEESGREPGEIGPRAMRKIPAVRARMMVFTRVWVVSWSCSRRPRKDGRASPGAVVAGASKSIQG